MKKPTITYRPEAIAGHDDHGNVITVAELLQAKTELELTLALVTQNKPFQDVLNKFGKTMAEALTHARRCELEAKNLRKKVQSLTTYKGEAA